MTIRRFVGSVIWSLVLVMAVMVPVNAQTVLKFAIGTNPTLEEYAREYEALNPDIKIVLEEQYNREQLMVRFISGTQPDLFRTTEAVPYVLYADNALAPLPPHFAERLQQTFFPEAVAGLTWDGAVLAVPAWANITGLWYNRQVLQEKGIADIPSTWDELFDLAQRISTVGSDGVVIPALGTLPEMWSLGRIMVAMLVSEGGDLLTPDGRIALFAEESRNAINKMVEAVQRRALDIDWRGGRIGTDSDLAFSLGWNYFVRTIDTQTVKDVGAALLPAGAVGHSALFYHHAVAVAKGSNQEAAFDFLEWLTFEASPTTGLVPLVHSTAASLNLPFHMDAVTRFPEYYGEYSDAMFDFMRNMDYGVSVMRYIRQGVSPDVVGTVVSKILDGMSPLQAINDAIIEVQINIQEWQEMLKGRM